MQVPQAFSSAKVETKVKFSEIKCKKDLTNRDKRGIKLPASYAMAARRYMEMYSRGRRGAPAKGVGRVTGARVQISPSPPNKNRNSDTKELRFLFFMV